MVREEALLRANKKSGIAVPTLDKQQYNKRSNRELVGENVQEKKVCANLEAFGSISTLLLNSFSKDENFLLPISQVKVH